MTKRSPHRRSRSWRFWGGFALSASLAACSSITSTVDFSSAASPQPIPSPEAAAEVATEVAAVQVKDLVSYQVCDAIADWQRPDSDQQRDQIKAMPRYTESLADGSLQPLADEFFQGEVISFTTYGLSARVEPIYLSGLWTHLDDLWACYEDETVPAQINSGDLGELWLLAHRLVDFTWQGDEYVVTVEPTSTGASLVQFSRQEALEVLPLRIETTDGQPVTVTSGDF